MTQNDPSTREASQRGDEQTWVGLLQNETHAALHKVHQHCARMCSKTFLPTSAFGFFPPNAVVSSQNGYLFSYSRISLYSIGQSCRHLGKKRNGPWSVDSRAKRVPSDLIPQCIKFLSVFPSFLSVVKIIDLSIADFGRIILGLSGLTRRKDDRSRHCAPPETDPGEPWPMLLPLTSFSF